MLEVDVSTTYGGNTIENLIADILKKNPATAAAAGKKALAYMKSAQAGALRITAARLRKRILEAYKDNTLGWEKHQEYSNWFGSQGAISIAHLLRANRPKKAVTSKGKARRAGYSQTAINMPKPYQLGGRLYRATRYELKEDTFVVGVLPNSKSKDSDKLKMRLFQDGAIVTGDPEKTRRYFAALGIYLRRGTVLKSKPRPLYDKIQAIHDPAKMFEEAYTSILADKTRLGER